MSSGAHRYACMHPIDRQAAWQVLPAVLVGVAAGILVFAHLQRDLLRLAVGTVVGMIAAYQLYLAWRRRFGTRHTADQAALKPRAWLSFLAGSAAACTGTGVAHLPDRLLKVVFSLCVLGIGAIYVVTSLRSLL